MLPSIASDSPPTATRLENHTGLQAACAGAAKLICCILYHMKRFTAVIHMQASCPAVAWPDCRVALSMQAEPPLPAYI